MRQYTHLDEGVLDQLFIKKPMEFTRDTPRELLAYAVGAALYIPAIHKKLYEYLKTKKYKNLTTLVICLEDGIADDEVEAAEAHLVSVFDQLKADIAEGTLREADLPLLFVRIRSTSQLSWLITQPSLVGLLCGVCLPKFNSHEAKRQLELVVEGEMRAGRAFYAMPIMETQTLMSLETGLEELVALKAVIKQYKEHVLNIRIGATDLSGLFGIRRTSEDTIYDIAVIRDCMSRIINCFGQKDMNLVISGPVWEFFNTQDEGLLREVAKDQINGLIGKTVIHPSQVGIVNGMQAVDLEQYEDACQILKGRSGGVLKSVEGNKMNEMKPHAYWAYKVLQKAEIYGVIRADAERTRLF